jgi:hypothetical protein
MNFRTQERQIERTRKEIHQPAHLQDQEPVGQYRKSSQKKDR